MVFVFLKIRRRDGTVYAARGVTKVAAEATLQEACETTIGAVLGVGSSAAEWAEYGVYVAASAQADEPPPGTAELDMARTISSLALKNGTPLIVVPHTHGTTSTTPASTSLGVGLSAHLTKSRSALPLSTPDPDEGTATITATVEPPVERRSPRPVVPVISIDKAESPRIEAHMPSPVRRAPGAAPAIVVTPPPKMVTPRKTTESPRRAPFPPVIPTKEEESEEEEEEEEEEPGHLSRSQSPEAIATSHDSSLTASGHSMPKPEPRQKTEDVVSERMPGSSRSVTRSNSATSSVISLESDHRSRPLSTFDLGRQLASATKREGRLSMCKSKPPLPEAARRPFSWSCPSYSKPKAQGS
jgi:hypothetical protein